MIDAHQHFWRIARGDYAWMDESVAEIRRDFLPEHLDALATPLGVIGTVVVQAAPTTAETRFLLSLAAEEPSILGVVGWVDLAGPDVAGTLSDLAADRRFKGVRPMLQDIADTSWILRADVLDGLSQVAVAGLTFDALITPRHLAAIDDLAGRVPGLPIVIDHCAKPVFDADGEPGADWREGIVRLARHPQMFCKLSGLANEFGPGWSGEKLRPVFDHVLDCFGANRLMWGSDWPVLELAGDYAGWLTAARALTGSLSGAERSAIFGETAARFYSLATRA
jgi:L-fucono-1,5-lactonase